jgi:hypothetical protein
MAALLSGDYEMAIGSFRAGTDAGGGALARWLSAIATGLPTSPEPS